MVKIRLRRMGAHKKPFYRVVVADQRTARDGKSIEEIGTYDPLKNPAEINIDAEAAKKWLANGAVPTDTCRALLNSPDEVMVREIPGNDPGVTVVELKVAASDMGKIIGKQGRIVKALRTVVKAAAVKQNKKVVVEIVS